MFPDFFLHAREKTVWPTTISARGGSVQRLIPFISCHLKIGDATSQEMYYATSCKVGNYDKAVKRQLVAGIIFLLVFKTPRKVLKM